MSEKIGFGIIGAGMIASIHAEAIRNSEHCRLAGVFDPVKPAAEALAKKFDCRTFDSLAEMLVSDEVQAVTVATPSGMHKDICIAAADAGKHILCEKPLEINLDKVDAILEACRRNDVLLSPVFQSRFSRPVQLVKNAIAQGRFGQMLFAGMQMHWYRDESYYRNSNWRGTWAMDGGGALMNQAIHMIDLLLYLNGEPEEVFAFSGTKTHDIEVEDNLCAAVKYRNGSFGTIEVSTSCAPGFPRRMELAGSLGSIAFEENHLTRWEFSTPRPEDKEIADGLVLHSDNRGGGASPGNISAAGHTAQINDLAAAILTGRKLQLDGNEGRRAVELICGIYESCRTGKPVIFR